MEKKERLETNELELNETNCQRPALKTILKDEIVDREIKLFKQGDAKTFSIIRTGKLLRVETGQERSYHAVTSMDNLVEFLVQYHEEKHNGTVSDFIKKNRLERL